MNTILYGKTILIGREQDQSRLCISVTAGGKQMMCTIGDPHSVPNSVSRCQPNEGKAHCSIEIDKEGRMRVANLKSQNITCVDGNEVLKKYIDETAKVTLGRDQYIIDINTIIDTVTKMVSKVEKPAPKTFSIAHLEKIQQDYLAKNEEIEKEQNINMLMFRVPMIFSSIGAIFTAVAKTSNMDKNIGNISLILTLLGAIVMFYGMYRQFNNPAGKLKKDNMNEYKKNYICPNPDCGRKLTNFDYEELMKMKKCPFCGSKFE